MAKAQAEQAAVSIDWPDVYWRRDIGHRAVKREEEALTTS